MDIILSVLIALGLCTLTAALVMFELDMRRITSRATDKDQDHG